MLGDLGSLVGGLAGFGALVVAIIALARANSADSTASRARIDTAEAATRIAIALEREDSRPSGSTSGTNGTSPSAFVEWQPLFRGKSNTTDVFAVVNIGTIEARDVRIEGLPSEMSNLVHVEGTTALVRKSEAIKILVVRLFGPRLDEIRVTWDDDTGSDHQQSMRLPV